MKKRLLACGLVPALVLGTFGTVGAQPAADAAVQLKQGVPQLSRQRPQRSL